MATKEKDTNKELEVEEIVSRSEQFIDCLLYTSDAADE